MARRELTVTHYEAEMVIAPAHGVDREIVRITIFGPNFPQRAIEPEMLAGGNHAEAVSISRDQRSIRGLFSRLPAEGAVLRVRYGDSQEGVVRQPFVHASVHPLRREC